MTKKIAALALVACMLLASVLGVCSLVGIDAESDLNSVVAVVCGEQITKRMVMNEWNRQKAGMGVTDAYEQSEDGQRIISTVLQNLLQDMVKRVIRREQARELGLYPLTDENYDKVVARADEIYNTRLTQTEESLAESYAQQNGDFAESQLAEAAKQSVEYAMREQFEFSREMDLRQAEDEVITQLLKEYYGAGITAEESEIKAHYDELLEKQKTNFDEDTNGVVSYLKEDALIVYYPGQVVRVKHILLGFDESAQSEIAKLRKAGKDDEADALVQENARKIASEAKEALARARDGENFDDLIVEYGEDTGMMTQSQRQTGYYVCRDSVDYVESFRDACLELTRDGQISDLVLSDYGYHIIYAMNVYPQKTVPLDEIRDLVEDDLLESQRGVAYTRAMDEVYENAPVEYYYKRLLRGNLNTLDLDPALLVEENRFDVE